MKTLMHKLGLTSVLLALFIGCVQPPATPTGEVETSDEEGNTVTTQAVPTNGLKGEYFDNVDFTGILKTRYDASVNRTWNSSAPITGIQSTTYSVRWTGQVMPAFSQTYTFFVTSSDGARLMVNGQVLVNDWVDGASRVRSGTVALQANTKYDIRLEYYRNATNPGAVKLEWQSSSRTKQVVPQASLFPTSSNSAQAWQILQTDSRTSSSVPNLSSENVFVALTSKGTLVTVPLKNGSGFLRVSIKNGKVQQAYIFQASSSTFEINDLSLKRQVFSGNVADYFDNTPSNDSDQKNRLVSNFLSQNQRKLSAQTAPLIRPQVVPSDICPECTTKFDTYINKTSLLFGQSFYFFGTIALAAQTCLTNPITSQQCVAAALFSAGQYLPASIIGTGGWDAFVAASWDATDALEDWEFCKLTQTCPYKIVGPTPSEIQLTIPVGGTGVSSFQVQNVGIWDVFIRESTNSPRLRLDVSNASTISVIDGRRVLKSNTIMTVTVTASCPQSGQFTDEINLAATAYVAPDPDFNELRKVTVKLQCGEPKISVTPNPLELVAALNSSTSGTLTVSNAGDAPLEVTGVASNQGWLTVPTTGFTVAPGSSQSVEVNGTCDGTVGTKPSATVAFSTATTGSSSAAVTLYCGNNTYLYEFGGMIWTDPFGGFTDFSCGALKENMRSVVSYVVYRNDQYTSQGGSSVKIGGDTLNDCGGNDTFYREIDAATSAAKSLMPAAFSAWKAKNPPNYIYSTPWFGTDAKYRVVLTVP